MSENFQRVSPLGDIAIQGRFGADHAAPGVALSVQHPASIVTVIARKGKAKVLADALKSWRGARVQWAGTEQYFVLDKSFDEVRKKLDGLASCSDQSHGRVVIRIEGPKVRQVLCKGTPVDLHESEFEIGKSALTQMAHVGVHFTRVERDAFELSVFRGFSESFWEWLTEQAEEFGYQVV
ncbi:MAG TPA: sarcosine oxidase subunit gamma family protein [Aestuariivirga sp.]